jgi:hypothetical protein
MRKYVLNCVCSLQQNRQQWPRHGNGNGGRDGDGDGQREGGGGEHEHQRIVLGSKISSAVNTRESKPGKNKSKQRRG